MICRLAGQFSVGCAGRPARSNGCKPPTARCSERCFPRGMRWAPRGVWESVDRGTWKPAIEPLKIFDPGTDVLRSPEVNTHERVIASARAIRRSRRPWHARMLLPRDPGDLQSDRRCISWPAASHWEGEEPKPMTQRLEKSDLAVVPLKPANNAGPPALECMEPRAGPRETRTRHPRDGLKAAIAGPRGWHAYGRPQGKGRGRRSRRCCTMSSSTRCEIRSWRASAIPPRTGMA